jgi:4-hydroxy-3-polyprenylbenzoate decarboxylase
VDLARLPIQHCWPGDVAPLITWGLVIRGPHKARQNLGIYRQQVLGRNKVIMRWLAHRGGALDFREHCANPGQPFPVAVALGRPGDHPGRRDAGARRLVRIPVCRPAARRAHRGGARAGRAAAGAGQRRDRARRPYPARRHASGWEHALEGPYGDHTGYYNEQAEFPVFTIERITQRKDPSTTAPTPASRPTSRPCWAWRSTSVRAAAAKQFPEIVDFYLPPEGCSYRMALVRIKKAYPGHARA